MKTYKSLEHIANGIHAAGKIQNLYRSNIREDSDRVVKESNLSLLTQVMEVITHYSPDTRKATLENTLQRSTQYSHTYRDLRNHLKELNSKKASTQDLIKMMNLMKPALGNRHKLWIDKMMRVYQDLRS